MASPRTHSTAPSLQTEWKTYTDTMDNLWNHSHPRTGKPAELAIRGATFREMAGWRTFLEAALTILNRVAGIGTPIINYATIQRRDASTLAADHVATRNAVIALVTWLNNNIPSDETVEYLGLSIAQLSQFVVLLNTLHSTIES